MMKRLIIALLFLNISSLKAQESKIIKNLIKEEMSDVSGYIGINYHLLNIDSHKKEIPLYQVRLDMLRLCIDLNLNDIKSTNTLYYSINQNNFKTTEYKYSMLAFNGKFGALLKTFQIKKQVINFWAGYAYSYYNVRDINPNYLTDLVTPGDFIQIKRLAGTIQHEVFISIDKFFWVKNQEFSVRLTGSIPIKSKPATLSQYQYGGSDLLYNPVFRNLIELTFSYGIVPKFRLNPNSLKPL